MSHLAAEFEALMGEHNLRAADVARLSGVAEATISRLRLGHKTWASSEELQKLAAAFDSSRHTHARLLLAKLLDERTGPGAALVEVRLKKEDGPAPAGAVPDLQRLPPRLANALAVLASRIQTEKELRNIVLSLANAYTRGRMQPK